MAKIEIKIKIPCFHCSRSLSWKTIKGKRIFTGFTREIDGIERIFHEQCLEDYDGENPYFDETYDDEGYLTQREKRQKERELFLMIR